MGMNLAPKQNIYIYVHRENEIITDNDIFTWTRRRNYSMISRRAYLFRVCYKNPGYEMAAFKGNLDLLRN